MRKYQAQCCYYQDPGRIVQRGADRPTEDAVMERGGQLTVLRGGRPYQHSLAATELDILLALWDWKVGGGSDGMLLSVTCLPQAGLLKGGRRRQNLLWVPFVFDWASVVVAVESPTQTTHPLDSVGWY